ncbi:MAG: VOC family protein, partial [Proteobacteria bacterium]|nr:VOC family protein [Pseudomonadota bacterium]
MIDHLAVDVSDLKKSGYFYDHALKPLGYKKLMEGPQEFGGRLVLGWEDSAETALYIGEGSRNKPRL